jgi:prepilin-type N-terminal cleavage/methylation domain-containing protein/prepilin-type processing-associated H-X9-DG protein
MKIPSKATAAFTLIELLVVIAIIAVLASLAVPAVNGALKRGTGAACLSNLRQIGIATIAYAVDNDMVLPAAGGSKPEWATSIASYTGVDAKRNKSIFVCPGCEIPVGSGTDDNEVAVTYGMHGGLMPKGGAPEALDLVKNASSLILCADMCQNPNNKGWSPYSIENPGEFKGGGRGGSTSTSDAAISTGPDKDSGNNAWMRYRHSGSVNAVMGDGSARSFKKGTILSSNAKIVKD